MSSSLKPQTSSCQPDHDLDKEFDDPLGVVKLFVVETIAAY